MGVKHFSAIFAGKTTFVTGLRFQTVVLWKKKSTLTDKNLLPGSILNYGQGVSKVLMELPPLQMYPFPLQR